MSDHCAAGRPASCIRFEYRLDVFPERLADALHGPKILPSQDSAPVGVGRAAEVPGDGSELRNGTPQGKDLSLRERA